jgi:molecular chaperone GrpE
VFKKQRTHEGDEEARAADDAAARSPSGQAGEGSGEDSVPEVQPMTDLEVAQHERDEFEERWLRTQAEMQNLRRRLQADIDAGVRDSQRRLLDGLLLAIDYLELALSTPLENEEAKNLAVGVRMTRDQMLRTLEQEGVRAIPASGAFDPKLHEAIGTVADGGTEPGAIVDCTRAGYRWGDVVLRPAQVRVAADPSAASEGDERGSEEEA